LRFIARKSLTSDTEGTLSGLQSLVNGASTPAAEAARLWRARSSGAKRKKAFVEVRSLLKEMSSGRQRCMYCEDSEGTDIDHFCPKSRYPDVAFVWANYFHACSHCNSNEKRSDFPLDPAGKALLLDPSVDDPYDHIAFVPQTGQFQGVTERGETTVEVFGLQRRETLQHGRQDAWRQMSALVREYRRASNAKDAASRAWFNTTCAMRWPIAHRFLRRLPSLSVLLQRIGSGRALAGRLRPPRQAHGSEHEHGGDIHVGLSDPAPASPDA
jgi:uncharacterized protein (TIGR02646 family)